MVSPRTTKIAYLGLSCTIQHADAAEFGVRDRDAQPGSCFNPGCGEKGDSMGYCFEGFGSCSECSLTGGFGPGVESVVLDFGDQAGDLPAGCLACVEGEGVGDHPQTWTGESAFSRLCRDDASA